MSVCVIAQYPWRRIADLPGVGAPGFIVCSDTRVTRAGKTELWLLAKQSYVARNIVVCYTTAHGQAISLALHQSRGTRSVRQLGESLRRAHETYGGYSEVVAVIWRGMSPPQALELMPPLYRPKSREGIIGIGHRATLEAFRTSFREDPEPELRRGQPREILESLERQFGPIEFPPPFFPIEYAANHVVGALSGAIREAGDESVGHPLQLWTITQRQLQALRAISSADLATWDDVTTEREKTRLAPPNPGRHLMTIPVLSAVQLFA